jgi:hypothetical protein
MIRDKNNMDISYKDVSTANINNMDKYDKIFFYIIQTIGDNYNFNVNEYRIIKSEAHHICNISVGFKIKKRKVIFHISIEKFDKDKYLHDDVLEIKDLYRFFKSFDIIDEDLIALAAYVFVILHELGHIYRYNKYKNKIKKIRSLDNTIRDANTLFHNKIKSNKEYNKMIYTDLQRESNADVFAYKNFYLIWNKLKENKLI